MLELCCPRRERLRERPRPCPVPLHFLLSRSAKQQHNNKSNKQKKTTKRNPNSQKWLQYNPPPPTQTHRDRKKEATGHGAARDNKGNTPLMLAKAGIFFVYLSLHMRFTGKAIYLPRSRRVMQRKAGTTREASLGWGFRKTDRPRTTRDTYHTSPLTRHDRRLHSRLSDTILRREKRKVETSETRREVHASDCFMLRCLCVHTVKRNREACRKKQAKDTPDTADRRRGQASGNTKAPQTTQRLPSLLLHRGSPSTPAVTRSISPTSPPRKEQGSTSTWESPLTPLSLTEHTFFCCSFSPIPPTAPMPPPPCLPPFRFDYCLATAADAFLSKQHRVP